MPTERQVTRTKKDGDGDILALCQAGATWSPRYKTDAIRDIESGVYSYYVLWNDGMKTTVHVVNGPTGKYLRTQRDNTSKNNLDDLPDC